MPRLAISLLLLIISGAAHGAESVRYEQGQAWDLQKTRLLYTESHWSRFENNLLSERTVLYRCPDGTPFARKVISYAPSRLAPAFDFTAAFTLPGDWLKTLQVGQDGYEVEYRTESGKILASGTSLALRYIWRNTVPSTWDAMLIEAMQLAMAAAMAYGITKSASMVEVHEKKLELFMRRCRSTDGQDDPPETLGDFPLLQARFGGGNWRAPGR